MTLVLIFIAAAGMLYALYGVVAPFVVAGSSGRSHLLDEELEEIEELAARKSILMQSLRDIEFDRETGKLSEKDYRRLKVRREREALAVSKELEDRRGRVDYESDIDRDLRTRLERADDRQPDDEPAPSGLECPECGRDLPSDAAFCSGCGASLDGPTGGDDGPPASSGGGTAASGPDSTERG